MSLVLVLRAVRTLPLSKARDRHVRGWPGMARRRIVHRFAPAVAGR